MEKIPKEMELLNDVATILAAACGMQNCDANWERMTEMVDEKFSKHRGERTEDFASEVFAAMMKHIERKLTRPEDGQKGGPK